MARKVRIDPPKEVIISDTTKMKILFWDNKWLLLLVIGILMVLITTGLYFLIPDIISNTVGIFPWAIGAILIVIGVRGGISILFRSLLRRE